ncbi:MAG TPA: hypothetical protein VMF52_01445 [Steroidobacteraceae bacterium]|nr:hypothetical protein [Steroidobacteraceae bacterium]
MRHIVLSLFAIALAAVAAIAATTAMLNTPVRESTVAALPVNNPAPAATPATAAPAAGNADTKAPAPADKKPEAAGGAAPTGDAAKDAKEDEADADPYEGIAPEELPPDLQYSADSSVSFPTNI